MEETLILMRPDASFSDEIASYRQDFLDAGDSMDGMGPLRECETPAEWFEKIALYENPETLPEGRVLATQYILVRKEEHAIVGMLQLRHYLNEYLWHYAGHIGYSVRPSERRKGYAKEMLRQALSVCRSMGLSKVMITCFRENEGSRRTILSGGGVYESTVYEKEMGKYLERYWIALNR